MVPPPSHRRNSDSSESSTSSFTYRNKTKTYSEELEGWFSSLGLYRKFIARNESCIFRAVSDSRFLTQSYYHFVHRDLVGYTEKLCPNQFLLFSKQSEITKDTYLEMLKNPLYYKPSPIDLCIISKMYGYNFQLYSKPYEPPLEIISCVRNETIMLYTDFECTYDLIYTQERYRRLAFCQHIVYEIYYKMVFKLEDIDYAVKKMLCQDSSPTRLVPGYSGVDTDGFCPNLNIEKQVMPLNAVYAKRFEMRAKCSNMRRLLEVGITPFPYKVAKALDPFIYRNIEFDVWVEQKRGSRCGLEIWSNSRLVRGVSCIVRFPNGEGATCHIQDVDPVSKEYKVYVVKEKQGRMITVPMEWLEPLGQNQVLVSYRRYLRDSWAEATEQVLARKKSVSSEPEIQIQMEVLQCGDVSSSADITSGTGGRTDEEGKESGGQSEQYITPVITPRRPRSSNRGKTSRKLQPDVLPVTPRPIEHTGDTWPEQCEDTPHDQLTTLDTPRPLMMIPGPPLCYEPYYPGHMIEWQPCYPDLVPSPYNVLLDPAQLEYQGHVDYNYNVYNQEAPGYMMAPESHNTAPVYNTPPYVPTDMYAPVYASELQYPHELHNAAAVFSPDLHTASPVFFTEVQGGMYPPGPVFCDPLLGEVDPYLVPPPSYAFCHGPEMYQTYSPPPAVPEFPYYATVNQYA
ncbi:hypothetical protein M8J76_011552 [Diaphorina citri]|nr:hypothetical protein M8J76_011552 [Diaphorina citri]